MPIRRGGKKSRIRKQNAAKSVEFLSSILKNNLGDSAGVFGACLLTD